MTKNLPSDSALTFLGPAYAAGISTWELGCGLRAPGSSSAGPSVSTGVDRVRVCNVRGALGSLCTQVLITQVLITQPCPGSPVSPDTLGSSTHPWRGTPAEDSPWNAPCGNLLSLPHFPRSLSSSEGFCGYSRMLAAISCWVRGHNWSSQLEFCQGT